MRAGASVAAIGLGDQQHAYSFRDETGITFPLLVDEKRRTYQISELQKSSLLRLLRWDDLVLWRKLKADGFRQHKLGRAPLQLGGSFVFAPGNLDVFMHVNQRLGDDASIEKIVAAIAAGRDQP